MDGAAVRGSVTLAGLAERHGWPAPSGTGCSARGTRAGTPQFCSPASFSATVCGTAARLWRGTVTVAVTTRDGLVRVEVTDRAVGPGYRDCARATATLKAGGGWN
jgi:hypothetical protein